MSRILVAGVGNVLRTDDGFGPAVAARLGELPEGVDVIETGIGGIALLQEILTGYDGLVVIDSVDRGASPGTVFVIEPEIDDPAHVPDIHLANPRRVLMMAKAMGALPEHVVIIGCQPAEIDELGEQLTEDVERAVDVAVAKVKETVLAWV